MFPSTVVNRIFSYAILVLISTFNIASASDNLTVELSELGQFKTSYTSLKPVEQISGSKVIGQVMSKPGYDYQVTAPFDILQAKFTSFQGQFIEKGQHVATIEGVDAHHFIDERDTAKAIFLASKKYYQSITKSADSGTFKSPQWLEIVKSYREAKLNYEHYVHLASLIQIREDDTLHLISPISGILQLENSKSKFTQSQPIFSITPIESLFIKAYLPTKNIDLLTSISVNNEQCQLSIEAIEPIESQYKQAAWFKPEQACALNLGQQLSLTPNYTMQGYMISPQAIIEIENKDFIAVKSENTLRLEPVEIISKTANALVIKAVQLRADMEVLTSPLSIVQGKLLGLGE